MTTRKPDAASIIGTMSEMHYRGKGTKADAITRRVRRAIAAERRRIEKIIKSERRIVEASPGVGDDIHKYALATIDDILAAIRNK